MTTTHCVARRARWLGAALLAILGCAASGFVQSAPSSPYLEELTSVELRARIAGGATIALVPVGGTEQNGAHMVLGKHNVRAHLLAGRIAERLGNAIVAPTLAYVPEGAIAPPQGHMRYAGTISIDAATFETLLAEIARSLRQHGFIEIVFLGDHGGYQGNMERVAAKLNRDWARRNDPAHALALRAYYDAAQKDYPASLEASGHSAAEVGAHAGLADTSLSLAIAPALVRDELLARPPAPDSGVRGDPRRATAALGAPGIARTVDASMAAIRRGAAATH